MMTTTQYQQILNLTISSAEDLAAQGKIAQLSNLKGKAVFIYSSSDDISIPSWQQ
jgi:hypothetical protein